MDVLMTVLTFFIIISMTLTGQQIVNVDLPSAGEGVNEDVGSEVPPLVIGLDQQKQTLIDNQPMTDAQLAQQIQTYLQENPEGSVLLKADQGLVYEDVAELLEKMRDYGGDRVSLAIEQ